MGGIGGLIGAKGPALGSGGLESRGSGLGGGGSADTLGGLGTQGRGSGRTGYGAEGGRLERKEERGPRDPSPGPIVLGALDKSLVDAVMKRNMNQLRYCYQRELTRNPELGGKVTMRFVIGKGGLVTSAAAKSSSLGNAAVESCLAERIQHFEFPAPKGDGVVIVSYPFLFSR